MDAEVDVEADVDDAMDADANVDVADSGQTAEATIGPDGGELQSRDGRLTLIVPAGAVSADTVFSIAAESDPPEGARGAAYRLSPEGESFNSRVVVRIEADADSRVVTYAEDATRWAPLRTSWYDAEAAVAYGATTHFSLFSTHLITDNCECVEEQWCLEDQCENLCYGPSCSSSDTNCHLAACPPGPCDDVVCSLGGVCFQGVCNPACSGSVGCSVPGEECYGQAGCTSDPCDGVDCPLGEFCYAGTCYLPCTSERECDPEDDCYTGIGCTSDPCKGVVCPLGEVCYAGTCYPSCNETISCDELSRSCYDQRCAVDPCDGVYCRLGDVCVDGVCGTPCQNNTDCSAADSICAPDGRCTPSPCENVQCPIGDVCLQGTCFEPCGSSTQCSATSEACYGDRGCAADACDGITCGQGQTCHKGGCFFTCSDASECAGGQQCVDGRCASNACDEVMCPLGEVCANGNCVASCTLRVDCPDFHSTCNLGFCVPTACRNITCPTGETCFEGSCRPDTYECATDADCPGDRNACTFSNTFGAACMVWADAPGVTADPGKGPLDGTWKGYKYDYLRKAWLEDNFFGTFDITQAPQTTAFSGDFTWSATGATGSFTGDTAGQRFAFSTSIDSKTYEFTDCVTVSKHYVGCQFDDPNNGNNARAVALLRQ